MNLKLIQSVLTKNFPHEPTPGQENLIQKFAQFILNEAPNKVFVLKGYAGTGKTSFVRTLVKSLPLLKMRTVLMAPTGRAAKVLHHYSGNQAHTIHRKIYFHSTNKYGVLVSKLRENKHQNTLFIVDEASMVSARSSSNSEIFFEKQDLLSDLISYIYSGKNCQLLLIGDTAQLPPIGLNISPALDLLEIEQSFNLKIHTIELTEVVRQEQDSGILQNATSIRNQIRNARVEMPFFQLDGFSDIVSINGENLEDALQDAYGKHGEENVVIITRSNKRANIFNREIRNRILFREGTIQSGDLMMVVKNNYHWLSEDGEAGFIANGDIIEIQSVNAYKSFFGFEFAEVSIRMVDYPNEPTIDLTLLLDTIMSESPALNREQSNLLFQNIMDDYAHLTTRAARVKAVKENPFFNALQVKFANAMTCHKTQGGQWEVVFVEQGYLTPEMINTEYGRWLYTALTRATQKLYLLNFKAEFFE
ncbi:MAG TPA: ATP-dependent endonuclease [Bacteroidales bacterium]|nr:ATP-dependent endonuclease [Bacteroidales bacterium]